MNTTTDIERFYSKASYHKEGRTWVILLDDKKLHTPARSVLRVPTKKLAELIAKEWDEQTDIINPEAMPHTKLSNVAHDHMGANKQQTAGELVRFAASDVLCFRVAEPLSLQELQAEKWDPWLDWAEQRFGARLGVSTGLQAPEQPLAALEALRNEALRMEPFLLTALTHASAILGSTVLGFALSAGKIDAKSAFDLSRIEEDWQIKRWGEDEEASLRARHLLNSLQASTEFMLAAKA